MSGKIRELYDKSKLLAGSKLRKEADTLYYLAKKRLLLNIKGAFAAGENFVGKIGLDGRANLLGFKQPNFVKQAYVKLQTPTRTVSHYTKDNYRIIRASNGEILFKETSNYAYAYYPDDVAPIMPPNINLPSIYPQVIGSEPARLRTFTYENNEEIISESEVIRHSIFRIYSASGGVDEEVVGTSTRTYTVIDPNNAIITINLNNYTGYPQSTSPVAPMPLGGFKSVYYLKSNGSITYLVTKSGFFETYTVVDDSLNYQACLADRTDSTYISWMKAQGNQDGGYNFFTYPSIHVGNIHLMANGYGDASLGADIYRYGYSLNGLSENEKQVFLSQIESLEILKNAALEAELSARQAAYNTWLSERVVANNNQYEGYENHVFRHRYWLLNQSNETIDKLNLGELPNNVKRELLAELTYYSHNVGMGSIGRRYKITQTSNTLYPSYDQLVERNVFFTKNDGSDVLLQKGTCKVHRIETSGLHYQIDYFNFPVIVSGYNGSGLTKRYFGANFDFDSYFENAIKPNLSSPDAIPNSPCVVNGSYNTLLYGITDREAQVTIDNYGDIPDLTPSTISFSNIDISDVYEYGEADVFTYDADSNGDGDIDDSERSSTSRLNWYGKWLSYGESITVFPLEYVSLIDDTYTEVGMFPQAYDIARLIAIRIYASYRFTYKGDGEFSFVSSSTTPTLDEEGNEILAYTEFPFESTSLLSSSSNAIVVANGTAYDDVLFGNPPYKKTAEESGWLDANSSPKIPSRTRQEVILKGLYYADIEAGKITLNGLYEWCSMQT